ncbi:MAG: YggS family pyridoxal phosphate-dependent enzyme [Saprospiraceae bacterium]
MVKETLDRLSQELAPYQATLVAVSKTHPPAHLMPAYDWGQRDFGENKVQEMVDKAAVMPKDIRWHLIGHLQTNKVKFIAPFVHLIHAVDSLKLLEEISKRALQHERIIDVLLQFKIAEEDTKFGYDPEEVFDMLASGEWQQLQGVRIVGVMGMASFTEDETQVATEFSLLKQYFNRIKNTWFAEVPSFKEISMGMSGDYQIALAQGSTMVRVGSMIFGERNYL